MKQTTRDDKNKGFTLVELIVVIVILGILAAIAVPALVGYIDKSRTVDIIAETRRMVVATQTLSTEAYGKGNEFQNDVKMIEGVHPDFYQAVYKLGEKPESALIVYMIFHDHVLTELLYRNGDQYCLYKDGEYSIIDGSMINPIKDYVHIIEANLKGLEGCFIPATGLALVMQFDLSTSNANRFSTTSTQGFTFKYLDGQGNTQTIKLDSTHPVYFDSPEGQIICQQLGLNPSYLKQISPESHQITIQYHSNGNIAYMTSRQYTSDAPNGMYIDTDLK